MLLFFKFWEDNKVIMLDVAQVYYDFNKSRLVASLKAINSSAASDYPTDYYIDMTSEEYDEAVELMITNNKLDLRKFIGYSDSTEDNYIIYKDTGKIIKEDISEETGFEKFMNSIFNRS